MDILNEEFQINSINGLKITKFIEKPDIKKQKNLLKIKIYLE